MSITLDLNPEIERGLRARAEAKGVSIVDLAQEILAREVKAGEPSKDSPAKRRLSADNRSSPRWPRGAAAPLPASNHGTGQELVEVSARLQGVLTDEDVDTLFRRNPLPGRTVDLA